MTKLRLARLLFLLAPSLSFVPPSLPPIKVPRAGAAHTRLRQSSSDGVDDQAVEALRSLADFHDGRWQGKAKSFSLTADVAAGIVQRKDSPVYHSSVKLGLDVANRDFTMTETFQWDDKVSSRKVSLQSSNIDVDSVDGSYSLDQTLPDLPADLIGTSKLPQFLIEHCLAVSDDRRSRCWALYGVDGSLVRVVVSEETRLKSNTASEQQFLSGDEGSAPTQGLTAADLLEIQSDVDRLVDNITGEKRAVPTDDRIGQLANRASAGDSDAGEIGLDPHPASLLELSAGVWLGDIIIRDHPNVPTNREQRGTGFGSSTSVDKTKERQSTGFAEWSVGVQKIAWRWMWNFGEEIRQVNDVGRSMGAELVSGLASSLSGNVCVNEGLSRRIPKEDRMVYVDWNGDDVGFLLGSVSIQLPRYLTFDRTSNPRGNGRPFCTEFAVYQSAPPDTEIPDNEGDVSALPKLVCSKATRVYNYEGLLKQGCTSFFNFKRFGSEKDDV